MSIETKWCELLARFRPLGDRVLVRKNKISDTSEGGILIKSDTVMPSLMRGVVIRAGKGCVDAFKAQDTVVFSRYAGVDLETDDLLVLKEAEIVGVICKKKT